MRQPFGADVRPSRGGAPDQGGEDRADRRDHSPGSAGAILLSVPIPCAVAGTRDLPCPTLHPRAGRDPMKTPLAFGFLALVLTGALSAQHAPAALARQRAIAARVTITRDDWGIAHVHGRTDADAVFGMIYAQAEDDFNRVEMNYLTALGRTAEAEGESAIWGDLRERLYVDPVELKAEYRQSP